MLLPPTSKILHLFLLQEFFQPLLPPPFFFPTSPIPCLTVFFLSFHFRKGFLFLFFLYHPYPVLTSLPTPPTLQSCYSFLGRYLITPTQKSLLLWLVAPLSSVASTFCLRLFLGPSFGIGIDYFFILPTHPYILSCYLHIESFNSSPQRFFFFRMNDFFFF